MRARWRSFKSIVQLWVDLFDRHDLLTYASAVALQALIAGVAFLLLGLGILGETHDRRLWNHSVGPTISGRVLPEVYTAVNAVVQRVFETSSAGLIAFATALAIWEVSGVVRAATGAFGAIYSTPDERPWWIRFPLSFGIAVVLNVALLGAVLLVLAIHASGAWAWPLTVVRWLAAVGLLVAAFGILVRWAPPQRRATRWISAGAVLVVTAWIVETLIFRWYLTSVADFRTAVGSFTVFIFATSYFYVGAIILLVGMELDELVRLDVSRPHSRQVLLPLVAGVVRGPSG